MNIANTSVYFNIMMFFFQQDLIKLRSQKANMLAKPLLRTETDELEKCILCNRPIQPSEVKQAVGVQGLKAIEEKAKIWAKIIDIEIDGPPTPKSRTICFF